MRCNARCHVLAFIFFTLFSLAQGGKVVIYGSTPSAIISAVASARSNITTTLIDPALRLGGLMTGGLGYSDIGDTFTIGGLAHEFFLRNARHYNTSATQPLYYLEPHVAEAVFYAMLNESGVVYIPVRGATIVSTTYSPTSHTQLTSFTLSTGLEVVGDVFVDGTYEGDLLTAARITTTFGREATSVYNETWAGRREPFGLPFDARPISPLDDAGELLPLLTSRTFAPLGSGDSLVQGYNYRLCAVRRSETPGNFLPMPTPEPYNASRWEILRRLAQLPGVQFFSLGPLPSGKADMNNGALISTDFTGGEWDYPSANASGRAAIREAHKQYMLQMFHFLATNPGVPPGVRASVGDVGLCADEFASNGGWPEQLYVREVRRMVGDRVLVQGQVWGGEGMGATGATGTGATGTDTDTPPPTTSTTDWGNASIGMGSYAADGHYAQRGPCVAYNDSGGAPRCRMVTSEAELAAARAAGTLWTGGEGYVGDTSASALYQIPYFVLLGRAGEASNVLSPTCPSVSHVVFASLRVEPTWMVMGHATGVAAALAVQQGVGVQAVDTGVLHERLAQQGAVLCKNKFPHC